MRFFHIFLRHIGADEGTRTHMVSHRNLKPARLPVSPHPHIEFSLPARHIRHFSNATAVFFRTPFSLTIFHAVPPLVKAPVTLPLRITIAESSSNP